ncbi:MAG: right-handed parallel beta-helix repeat-containing protein, partial [Thermoplasmata archaeon]
MNGKLISIWIAGLTLIVVFMGFITFDSGDVGAYTPHDPIIINGDENFTAANGVTGGSGTWDDPYIIEGWEINLDETDGIKISNTNAHFVIRNVHIYHGWSHSAISFFGVENGRVEHSKLEFNKYFLYMAAATNITIDNNTISYGYCGFYLNACYDISIVNNTLNKPHFGIYSYFNFDSVIAGNTFSGSWHAIDLKSSDNFTIADNVLARNYYSIFLNTSTDISVHHNDIFNNGYEAYDNGGSENSWDNGPISGGNFWGNYSGVDLNGDGIGDTPYIIDEDSQDNHPLMQPNLVPAAPENLQATP